MLTRQRTPSSPFFQDPILYPISSVRLLPTASKHVGTSATGAKASRDELCFLVVLAHGGGQWILHRSTKSLKHLLANIPLLPRHISASALRPPRRSLASVLFSVRDTAYEVFEAAVESLLAWLFAEATDVEFGTGSEPRIRDWFAPDDVRKASRKAAKATANAIAAQPVVPTACVSAPPIPRRSTSNLLASASIHDDARLKRKAALGHAIELDLSEDEHEWAPENWLGKASAYGQGAGGSTPNLLNAVAAKPFLGGELRATISHTRLDRVIPASPLNKPSTNSDSDRTPTLKSYPSCSTLRPAGQPSLAPASTPPPLRPARSLKSIRSFGDLKDAAKDGLGLGAKQQKKKIVPPVPKVEDWQRSLALSPPVSPSKLSASTDQQARYSKATQDVMRGPVAMPPLHSPPRKPLPPVPTGPRRAMPSLASSRSMEMLRLASSSSDPISLSTASGSSVSAAQPIRSLASSISTSNLSTRSAPLPPAIPQRQTSLWAPPRPQSRPTLPKNLSTTTYGVTSDVVLKLLYPERGCNILLRVPRTATLSHVKSQVQEKFAKSGSVHLPPITGDWGLAYSSTWKAPAALPEDEEPSFTRCDLEPNSSVSTRHQRMGSASTTSTSQTARSSLSSSSGRASTALTIPSYGSRRSSVFALITNEADWQEAMAGWRDGKVVLRIMC